MKLLKILLISTFSYQIIFARPKSSESDEDCSEEHHVIPVPGSSGLAWMTQSSIPNVYSSRPSVVPSAILTSSISQPSTSSLDYLLDLIKKNLKAPPIQPLFRPNLPFLGSGDPSRQPLPPVAYAMPGGGTVIATAGSRPSIVAPLTLIPSTSSGGSVVAPLALIPSTSSGDPARQPLPPVAYAMPGGGTVIATAGSQPSIVAPLALIPSTSSGGAGVAPLTLIPSTSSSGSFVAPLTLIPSTVSNPARPAGSLPLFQAPMALIPREDYSGRQWFPDGNFNQNGPRTYRLADGTTIRVEAPMALVPNPDGSEPDEALPAFLSGGSWSRID